MLDSKWSLTELFENNSNMMLDSKWSLTELLENNSNNSVQTLNGA